MIEPESRLTELENVMRRLPAAKRRGLLTAISDLFFDNLQHYGPAKINLFDRLFNQLIDDAGTEAAAALARRLAALRDAPMTIIGRLAADEDIMIAEPLLMRSSCLENSLLLDIARARGQSHLLAIACRTQIAQELVDVLLERGDDVVVRYVANNRGARLSDAGVLALIERAKSDETLAILVSRRQDIPPQLLANLPQRTTQSATNAAA